MIVMDLKTPDSQESEKNLLSNIPLLKKSDQIKFVLCSRLDYDWACQMIHDHQLMDKAQLLFSPSWGQLNPATLADWIVSDRLAVRFQLQLHKILWNDTPGR
jgi:7-carboxy-7-deazaguanine synthase